MQNITVKEFLNPPGVEVFIINEGPRFNEDRQWLETYWNNYYLRGKVLFDAEGLNTANYRLPNTGIPECRGFIIDQDGNIARPFFGHKPDMVIETIYDMLNATPVQIGMIPDHPPIRVPAGSLFTFAGSIHNNTRQVIRGDIWIKLRLPNGSHYGTLYSWRNIQLQPRQNVTLTGISQTVPVSAPAGDYKYIACAGIYPNTIIDSSFFEFTVAEPPISGKNGNWSISGWFGDESVNEIPQAPAILNCPNPFNNKTSIRFSLPESGNVELKVYNIRGQLVNTLLDGHLGAGQHAIEWDASGLSSGIYFYRLETGNHRIVKKAVLIK